MRTTVAAALLALAAAAPIQAGAAPKAVRHTGTVQGFHTMTFKVRFQAGQPAVVVVQGDGDTPLALVVLDAHGKRVAADAVNVDRPAVRWTPASAEPYQVKVVNRGGVPNRFLLRTN
jgi:hypothetical protein